MGIPFCDYHIVAFLTDWGSSKTPLDLALSRYFKTHRSLGSRDRQIIGDAVFEMIRWKTLLDYYCPNPDPLERLRCFRNADFNKNLNPSIPAPIRLGIPDLLLQHLERDLGHDAAKGLCKVLNTQAPTTVRANLLKTTRHALLDRWAQFPVSPCAEATEGIRFHKRISLFSLPEFKQGLFEVQDEGSQLVASLVAPAPGDVVCDFCSGSGGKTLAFAPRMQGRGQIYLHDIRASILLEARKRLKRAGIQNAQCLPPNHPQLSRLKEKCDWVLADVPCSGTGTLRRNPDQKWHLDALTLSRLIATQKEIVQNALSYLKPGGKFVYATCSILSIENQAQVEYFLGTHPLILENMLTLLPKEGGMDGFFAAVFRKIGSVL